MTDRNHLQHCGRHGAGAACWYCWPRGGHGALLLLVCPTCDCGVVFQDARGGFECTACDQRFTIGREPPQGYGGPRGPLRWHERVRWMDVALWALVALLGGLAAQLARAVNQQRTNEFCPPVLVLSAGENGSHRRSWFPTFGDFAKSWAACTHGNTRPAEPRFSACEPSPYKRSGTPLPSPPPGAAFPGAIAQRRGCGAPAIGEGSQGRSERWIHPQLNGGH